MAEATGLRNNALPYPVYGAPWGIVFPLLDADGDPVSPSSPDSEISKNGDTFADCTNEAVEIATSSGSCYLLLTATEMTADVVVVQIKSTGAKTTVVTLYPRKLVTIRSGTSASGGVSTSTIVLDASASAVDDFYNGMVCIATIDTNVEVRVISDYTGSTQTATVVPDWNVAPDNNDTFIVKLPEGAQVNQANVTHIAGTAQTARDIGASVLISSGTGTGQLSVTSGVIASNVTQFGGSNGTFASGRPEVNTTHAAGTAWGSGAITAASIASNAIAAAKIATGAITNAKFAAGAIDAAAIASDAITAAKIAADAITAAKIANGAIDAATFAADVDAEILSYIVDDATRIDASALNTASVTTIPAILVDTAEIGAAGAGLTEAGGTGDHLTAVPWNAAWDAEVESEVADALAVYDPPTKAELDTAVANVSVDEIQATALADLFNTDSGTTYASAVAGSVVKEIADNAGGSSLTAADIADAVWDEAQADHVGAGSFGLIASEVADILVDTAEIGAAGAGLTNINLPDQTMNITGNITGNLSGSVGSVTGLTASDVAAIKAKTDSLTFTVANQVDSNIQYVNDVAVTGTGASGDEWGP